MKNKEIEIWKDIKGYEGLYQVSSFGRIKSYPRQGVSKEHYLTLHITRYRNNYLEVFLSKNSKRKHFKVHRLVALAFIPNSNNLPEINHKDENKQNNHISNLEWCERKYNLNYGTVKERRSKANYKKIYQISVNNYIIKEWNSIKEAGNKTGICRSGISACCRGVRKTASGFKWKFKN